MTPRDFVRKWKEATLKERSAAQEHFLDLCELVGHGKPAALDPAGEFFCFEKGAEKRGGAGTVRWPRVVARDAEAARKLAKRTLTNLYNERPAWLDLAHKKLDAAVLAAYGWPSDLTDEQILEKLLALNLERAVAERGEHG